MVSPYAAIRRVLRATFEILILECVFVLLKGDRFSGCQRGNVVWLMASYFLLEQLSRSDV
jgi:hypothetical protein